MSRDHVVVTEPMGISDRELLLLLCGLAQRGMALTLEQERFIRAMHRKYPEEYKVVHTEAWNENAARIGSTLIK